LKASRGHRRRTAAALICLCAGAAPFAAPAMLAPGLSEEPEPRAPFVAWARTAAINLASVESIPDESDLAPLCTLVGDARVVALGEPGHGAHQPLALRNRLFGYLIEHCGFTAIALETSFSESRAVHDFVQGGGGKAADVTRRSLTWGFGDYAENVALIEWMRDYNRRAAERRQIQFYGIDLSGADNDSAFPHAGVAIQGVVRYLRSAAPRSSSALIARLGPLLDRTAAGGYAQLAASHDHDLDTALGSLDSFLASHAAALRRASTKSDYDWAVRELIVARQLRNFLSLDIAPSSGAAMSPDEYKQVNVRDAAMADNLLWVTREEGVGGRVLVFAHDAHVMNAPARGGIWSVFSQPPRMMGQHLRAALGETLFIVGSSAARSGAGLPAGAPLANCTEDALSEVGLPPFLLDLRPAARDPGARAWLDRTRPLRANFSTELDVNLQQAFDAVAFIDELTPAMKNSEDVVH
jgi:erythromycin esterase